MQCRLVFVAVCSLFVLAACQGQGQPPNPAEIRQQQLQPDVPQPPGVQAAHAQPGHAGQPAAQAAHGQAAAPAQPGSQPAFHHGSLPDPDAEQPREAPNPLRNRDHVQDLNHMKEHLDPLVGKSTSEMSEEELQFHYFTQHDYDKNNRLDGIELVSAMTHFHEDDHDKSHNDPQLTEEEITATIDQILRDDDRNRDGFIDYAEFKASQANES
ncbi:MCFD2 [Branchiostoma lanceolatum]|uniref:MCFD2 protein n=1 Tax=Branchiostoma lanceolatum TaxID=7740 RepID=A0A8K0EPY3_BRALA|nr:MCFD2 [Branchiostoma lanceolatum]